MSGGIGAMAGQSVGGTAPAAQKPSQLGQAMLYAGAAALGVLTAPSQAHRGTKEDFRVNPGDAERPWPWQAGTFETVPHLITYSDFDSKMVRHGDAIKEMALGAGIGGLTGYIAGGGNFVTSPPPSAINGLSLGAINGAIVSGLGSLRTASYKYYCSFTYGLGHGPYDAILWVKFDEKVCWDAGFTFTGNTGSFLIDKRDAWGGEQDAGGVYFYVDALRGDFWPNQQPNPYLLTQYADAPAFSGKGVLVLRGPSGYEGEELSGYFASTPAGQPSVRPVKVKARRLPNNLGVSEFKAVNTHDANPAECSYEWLTSPAFGVKKLNPSRIDISSFQDAAEQYHTDGIGYSGEFNAETDVPAALDTFTKLTDSVMWGGFRTGTIKLKPIRRDYSIPSLPVFTRGNDDSITDKSEYNVVAVEGFTPGAWANTFNQIKYSFEDRDNNYQKTDRTVSDDANRQIQGRTRTVSQDLRGTGTGAQAALIGTRELRAGSYPRPPITLHVNREGYELEPSSVIKFVDNVLGVVKILRVLEMRPGSPRDATIKLVCAEDVFGVGAAAFSAGGTSFTNPAGTPEALDASSEVKVQEAPYFLSGDDDARLLVLARKPSGSQVNFDVHVSTDGGTSYVQEASAADFTPTATLDEAILRLRPAVITSLAITPENSTMATLLSSAASAADVSAGQKLFQIDSEFFAYESVTNNGDGTFTLGSVWSAVGPLDSVPSPHAIGARVWFLENYTVTPSDIAAATATRTKIAPRTLSDVLDVDDAAYSAVTTGTRSLKPLPVRGVTVGGSYTSANIGASDDVVIAWNETSRAGEGSVVKQTDAGVAPEATTTYTVRWYATEGGGNVLLRTESSIAASTGTQTATMTTVEEAASPNYLGHLSLAYRVEVEAVRGGNTSVTYIREFTRTGGGSSGFVQVNGVDVVIDAELVQAT